MCRPVLLAVRPQTAPFFGSSGGCRSNAAASFGSRIRLTSGPQRPVVIAAPRGTSEPRIMQHSRSLSRVAVVESRPMTARALPVPSVSRLRETSAPQHAMVLPVSYPANVHQFHGTAVPRALPQVQAQLANGPASVGSRRSRPSSEGFLPDAACLPADEAVVAALDVVLSQMAESTAPGASADGCFSGKSLFHASQKPRMPVSDYFGRMRRYFNCSNECFVMALIYIDRVCKRHPLLSVDSLSCHRLFLVATIVALKYQDDDYHDNGYYAKIGGLSTKELNTLEMEFVQMLDWKMVIQVKDFSFYRDMMLFSVGRNDNARN